MYIYITKNYFQTEDSIKTTIETYCTRIFSQDYLKKSEGHITWRNVRRWNVQSCQERLSS